MDGQEYLNQISASVRPEKKSSKMGGRFMQSPIFKVLISGVAALILIIILFEIPLVVKYQKAQKEYDFVRQTAILVLMLISALIIYGIYRIIFFVLK